MKLRTLLTITAAGAAMMAQAAYITPKEALARMQAEPAMQEAAALRGVSRAAMPARTFNDADGVPAVYLFNNPGTGYVVLSADSDVIPVLGYSDGGDFDPENMPPAMQFMLEEYGREISAMRAAPSKLPSGTMALPDEWEMIRPMVTTKWSQGDPYNRMTPIHNGSRCATGCVATGMAQVIKYYNYPPKGFGSISFNVSHIGDLSMNFAETEFDWEHMTDTYGGNSTNQEKDAVALLMKACGYATRMWYNVGSSGTQSSYIAGALREYFGFHKDLTWEERKNYYGLDWATMIYNNLKYVGPIIYGGYSNIGDGHCFVCDGYRKGLFHFNWGWGGMSDGYFTLTGLNPSDQGTGGSPGGFNYGQNAIIGMRLPDATIDGTMMKALSQTGTMTYKVVDGKLQLTATTASTGGWTNVAPIPVSFSIGMMFEPKSGQDAEPVYYTAHKATLEPGKKLKMADLEGEKMLADLAALKLADGEWLVSTAYCLDGEAAWTPVYMPYKRYSGTLLTVKGGEYATATVANNKATFEKVETPTEFYYGFTNELRVVMKNEGQTQLTYGLAPALMDGNDIVARGEGILVDIDPGETVDRKWEYTWHWVDSSIDQTKRRTYTFAIYDATTWDIWWKTDKRVSIEAATMPTVKLGKFKLQDHSRVNNIYQILDPSKLNFESEVWFSEGELPSTLQVSLWGPDPETGDNVNLKNVEIAEFTELTPGSGGNAAVTEADFSMMEPGKTYKAYVSYFGFGKWNHLVNRTSGNVMELKLALDPAGVNDIETAKEADAEYYNLNGLKVSADKLTPGIYVKKQGGKITKVRL